MPRWNDWLQEHDLGNLVQLPQGVLQREWAPTENDRAAAWELYTEMRTRITTQPLHYRDGDEATALQSVYTLFQTTRDLLRKYRRKCSHFAILSVFLLNRVVRPFTARFHKIKEAGKLQRQDDCRIFRHELARLRVKLIGFQRLLGLLAEGNDFAEESETGFRHAAQPAADLGADIVPTKLLNLPADAPDVYALEREEICKRRKTVLNQVEPAPANLVGLAISGGGIRSATLALGAVQLLAEKGILKEIDYLSTVSGGGYLGSFVSSYLNSTPDVVGPAPGQQPFTEINNTESPPVRHLRNHSKYLNEGGWIEHLRMIGQAVYGVLTNLLIVGPILVLLAGLSLWQQANAIHAAVWHGDYAIQFSLVTLFFLAALALFVLLLGPIQNLGRNCTACDRFRSRYETAAAYCLFIALVLVAFDLQPIYCVAFKWIASLAPAWINAGAALMTPTALAGLASIVAGMVAAVTTRPKLKQAMWTLLWLTGPSACALLYFSMILAVIDAWHNGGAGVKWYEAAFPIPYLGPVPCWVFLLVDVGIIAYGWFFLNINMTSPHRYYRDQLSRTYLLKPGPNGQPVQDDLQKLSHLGATGKTPYHLLNGALNLAYSKRTDLLGRRSDFFLFSKHYCGSPILGYRPTHEWEHLDGHLNLGTALAISGAAAAPIMGMVSITGASFLLALLNVRLAYWLRDPNPRKICCRSLAGLTVPGPWYLLCEMFGWTQEESPYVNVSDGGHLENLGLYELLRRQCKFIIALDGECDPALTCGSFVQVMRFAEIDFGITIQIDLSELRTLDAHGRSKAHFAFGKIDYGNHLYGFILYLKSSLTGNEPAYVLSYKQKSPCFPHETTAQQLYEEDQFEAYRALGYHQADDLFKPELTGDQTPTSVRAWFQRLADSLLAP